jgi:hypothetical protein
MIEAHNCPFCGNAIKAFPIATVKGIQLYGVRCKTDNCWLSTDIPVSESTPDGAVQKWNCLFIIQQRYILAVPEITPEITPADGTITLRTDRRLAVVRPTLRYDQTM